MLREYYSTTTGATEESALLQQPAPIFHTKSAGEGSSIIGILEVIESDFAKDLAEKTTAEEIAAAEYEKMTQANEVTKTTKEQDVSYKTQEFKTLDESVAELGADKETLTEEQSAVLEYYEKLKDRCVAKPETYESRKARREAEIKGLKEALAVLENESAFVQRRHKGHAARSRKFLAAQHSL